MQVNPQAEYYTDIMPVDNILKEGEEAGLIESAEEAIVNVIGPKDSLIKLQDDLRKAGYRKMQFGRLVP